MLGWIEFAVFIYFLYVVAYSFIFSVAGLTYRISRKVPGGRKRFAVFIPAYKEDGVIVDVARKALSQAYPADRYHVVIIADSLKDQTLSDLRQLPVTVVDVKFESSTKVKSLNYALQTIDEHYDYAVILDADNVMLPDFLERMNSEHQGGLMAIQGQRMAKNKDNAMSFLDGLSEAINNHIYRQGSAALGLSASINGSGISFHFQTLKELLGGMDSIGGFDRELELLLLEKGIKVSYRKNAMVLDEKVQKTAVFENQRKRWISSQYHYLAKYFSKGCEALLRGNFTYFNSAVLRNIQLPRLINLGLLSFFCVALYWVMDYLVLGYWVWPTLLGLMVFSMLMAIPSEYYTRELLSAALKVPGLFLRMFMLLFKLRGANKKFIHTPHGVVTEKPK